MILGLDITALSVAWPALPGVKKLVRSIRIEDARAAARKALAAPTSTDVIRVLTEGIGPGVDPETFPQRGKSPVS